MSEAMNKMAFAVMKQFITQEQVDKFFLVIEEVKQCADALNEIRTNQREILSRLERMEREHV